MPSAFTDGTTYDRISAPLERIGREVLERLALRGDETVLDAGCGSGRVTQALVERLPRGRVIGVDGSAGMIASARERLAPYGDRVELRVADLETLDLGGEQVDAILSTATFHWIADHEALFARLHAALRPGGRLVAQCGGAGNTVELVAALEDVARREPFARHLPGPAHPWHYPTPEETEARLRAAGFTDVATGLVRKPPPYDELRPWLRTNALTVHLERLPSELHDAFVDAVAGVLGEGARLTYVRLNLDATRA